MNAVFSASRRTYVQLLGATTLTDVIHEIETKSSSFCQLELNV